MSYLIYTDNLHLTLRLDKNQLKNQFVIGGMLAFPSLHKKRFSLLVLLSVTVWPNGFSLLLFAAGFRFEQKRLTVFRFGIDFSSFFFLSFVFFSQSL